MKIVPETLDEIISVATSALSRSSGKSNRSNKRNKKAEQKEEIGLRKSQKLALIKKDSKRGKRASDFHKYVSESQETMEEIKAQIKEGKDKDGKKLNKGELDKMRRRLSALVSRVRKRVEANL